MNDETKYPLSPEINDVMKAATKVLRRAEKWKEEGEAEDDEFIRRHIDNMKLEKDDIPNGEEVDQLRREILPNLDRAVRLVAEVKNGKKAKEAEAQLNPEQARAKLAEAEEIIDQAISDVDGLGKVRRNPDE